MDDRGQITAAEAYPLSWCHGSLGTDQGHSDRVPGSQLCTPPSPKGSTSGRVDTRNSGRNISKEERGAKWWWKSTSSSSCQCKRGLLCQRRCCVHHGEGRNLRRRTSTSDLEHCTKTQGYTLAEKIANVKKTWKIFFCKIRWEMGEKLSNIISNREELKEK